MAYYERTYGVGISYNGEDAFLAYPPDEDGIYVNDFLYELQRISESMEEDLSNDEFFKNIAEDTEVNIYENDEEDNIGLFRSANEEDWENAMNYTVLNAQVSDDNVEIFNLIISKVDYEIDYEKQQVVVFPSWMAECINPNTGELNMNSNLFYLFVEFFTDLPSNLLAYPDGNIYEFSFTA